MKIPTYYTVWPSERPGYMFLGVWDSRTYDPQRAPGDQLQRVLYFDELPINFAFTVGSTMIQMGVYISNVFAGELRAQFLKKLEDDHAYKPTSASELAKMSVFVAGLEGVDLDLPPPEESHD